jgi:hypothetical protein
MIKNPRSFRNPKLGAKLRRNGSEKRIEHVFNGRVYAVSRFVFGG